MTGSRITLPWSAKLGQMDGPFKDRWQELCKQVADEKDPAIFTELVKELLEELRMKDERLKLREDQVRRSSA